MQSRYDDSNGPETQLELQTSLQSFETYIWVWHEYFASRHPSVRDLVELVWEIVDRVALEDTSTALEPRATWPRNLRKNYTFSMRTWILRICFRDLIISSVDMLTSNRSSLSSWNFLVMWLSRMIWIEWDDTIDIERNARTNQRTAHVEATQL